MFGYINGNTKKFSGEQKTEYEKLYSSLHAEIKASAGVKGRLHLKEEMVFLALLLEGIYGEDAEVLAYAADMSVLISYCVLKADFHMERQLSRRSSLKTLHKGYERIICRYERQAKAMETYIKKRSIAEAGREKNLDAISGLTGEMLGELFDFRKDEYSEELRSIGFYLGKFCYLLDAYENLEADRKKGVYNPFLLWKTDNKKEDLDTFVRLILSSMTAEGRKSFERLSLKRHKELLKVCINNNVFPELQA